METFELLRIALATAEALEIPHMLVGSLASMRYGEPRQTLEICRDLVSVRHITDRAADLAGEL